MIILPLYLFRCLYFNLSLFSKKWSSELESEFRDPLQSDAFSLRNV